MSRDELVWVQFHVSEAAGDRGAYSKWTAFCPCGGALRGGEAGGWVPSIVDCPHCGRILLRTQEPRNRVDPIALQLKLEERRAAEQRERLGRLAHSVDRGWGATWEALYAVDRNRYCDLAELLYGEGVIWAAQMMTLARCDATPAKALEDTWALLAREIARIRRR